MVAKYAKAFDIVVLNDADPTFRVVQSVCAAVLATDDGARAPNKKQRAPPPARAQKA